MDFMDFEVYYYLSEEDKQSYLNSIGFSRVDYLISYNTWFSNPNNPITNSVTKTINIRACSNGNLINNSFVISGTSFDIDNKVNSFLKG